MRLFYTLENKNGVNMESNGILDIAWTQSVNIKDVLMGPSVSDITQAEKS